MVSKEGAQGGEGKEGSRGVAPGRQGGPGGGSAVAPVVLLMEDLTLWVMERVRKFPRDQRFTLGDRLIEACLCVLDDLVAATFTRDKLSLLTRAARGLTRSRVLIGSIKRC